MSIFNVLFATSYYLHYVRPPRFNLCLHPTFVCFREDSLLYPLVFYWEVPHSPITQCHLPLNNARPSLPQRYTFLPFLFQTTGHHSFSPPHSKTSVFLKSPYVSQSHTYFFKTLPRYIPFLAFPSSPHTWISVIASQVVAIHVVCSNHVNFPKMFL